MNRRVVAPFIDGYRVGILRVAEVNGYLRVERWRTETKTWEPEKKTSSVMDFYELPLATEAEIAEAGITEPWGITADEADRMANEPRRLPNGHLLVPVAVGPTPGDRLAEIDPDHPDFAVWDSHVRDRETQRRGH